MIRSLAILACLLTVCITGASAFIRHAQSGPGCDGQPGCLQPMHERSAGSAGTTAAGAHQPRAGDAAFVAAKPPRAVIVARTLHRVSASVVGLLAIGLLVFGWNGLPRSGRVAALVALLISAFLAWLGRYTPHPLPWVTIGNVGGGFALAAAFACVAACRGPAVANTPDAEGAPRARPDGDREPTRVSARSRHEQRRTSTRTQPAGLAIAAGALLAALLWLGLMIGARDAIPACPTLLCLDGARFDPSAFDPAVAQASASPGSGQALHLAHRFIALAFALVVSWLAWRLRLEGRRALGVLLVAMLAAQIALGLATAGSVGALASATLHNVVAALWAAVLAALATSSLQPGVDEARAVRLDARATARRPDPGSTGCA
ncbi:MAG: hypothetical protein GX644_17595 [Limnobacter sp.]|nr:hypothetical protein [Limnobacter sp.]